MARHPAGHSQQDATLRTMAHGSLISNAFSVRAAPGRFIRCRRSAIQNNVQTNTYDPRRHGATPSLLSCPRSVDGLVLADPTRIFPKMRSDKTHGRRRPMSEIPDEPAIGKNSFKHRALAPAGSLARRAALRTALQARPFPRTGASLLTGLGPHSLRSEPRP